MSHYLPWIAAALFAVAVVHHLLHQVLRAPGTPESAPCRHLAPARRGGGGVRLLGAGAGVADVCAARPRRGGGLPERAQFHRAAVRVRDHGGGRHPGGAGGLGCAGAGLGAAAAAAPAHRRVPAAAQPGAAAGVLHHRTGGDDAGGTDAARPLPGRGGVGALSLRDPGRAVRQHLDWRHAHAVCRAGGADGGRHLELGPRLHAHALRCQGGVGGGGERAAADPACCGASWPASTPRQPPARRPCRRW